LLRCSDGSLYAGHSDTLEQRIAQHNQGSADGYTRDRRPVVLEWCAEFSTREEALAAERQIKGWSRAKKQALIRGDWDGVSMLARRSPVLRDEASTSSASPQDERMSLSATASPSPPIIVLVRPQLGQNIGKAARAMLNFGLTELRLVSPRDGWPNPDAGPAASGADRVLEQAQVFDSVAAAIADCSTVFASTVRRRELIMPVIGPEGMAAAIHGSPGRSAILFGPERSGLASEDVALAGHIVTVPINPEFGSLNLAQAVILLAYEWSRGVALAQPPARDAEPPAPMGELDGMIGQLDQALERAGYFHLPDKTPSTSTTIRTVMTKPGWSSRELKMVRGMLRALVNPRARS